MKQIYNTDTHQGFVIEGAPSLGFVYLHVALTGGDGMDPPGIDVDLTDTLTANATFRETADITSAAIPVNDSFRIGIFDVFDGLARVIKVQFISGVMAPILIGSKGVTGYFTLLESDLTTKIMGKTIKLVGQYKFKIFEDAT